jgi:hypothetical protein
MLRSWGAPVDDHPDDEDRSPTPDRVQVSAPTTTVPATARVTLLLEGDVQQFTPEQHAGFVFVLARVVNVSPEQIRIVQIEAGSIKLIPREEYRAAGAPYGDNNQDFCRWLPARPRLTPVA